MGEAKQGVTVSRTGTAVGQGPVGAMTRALNAWIQVDLGALGHNLGALREWMAPAAPAVMAIVKANAYGHGATAVGRELERLGVEGLAVVWLAEAVALREAGVSIPIVVLGHSFVEGAESAVQHNITLTVHTEALGSAVAAMAAGAGKTARVQIKVDTGLHRSGVGPEEAVRLAEALRAMRGIEVEGLWTHMANADEEDDSFSEEQAKRFQAVAAQLEWIPVRHAGNSATALRRPELRLNAVRTGLALYGLAPSEYGAAPGLRPVLSLKARLARVARLAAGEGVSYGLTWRAGSEAEVGLVPVGYGDGWKRQLGGVGEVLVAGQRRPMIGRVMMDHFVVDVTGLGCAEGDEVVLLGQQGEERLDATEVGRLAGTISWDVLASLQARLPRLYVRDGLVVARA
ncbi:MAG: alanine racemase, partial [Dehalococcoidia bacterium]